MWFSIMMGSGRSCCKLFYIHGGCNDTKKSVLPEHLSLGAGRFSTGVLPDRQHGAAAAYSVDIGFRRPKKGEIFIFPFGCTSLRSLSPAAIFLHRRHLYVFTS